MRIGVLGINHKSADLSMRERVAKACYNRLNIESPAAQALHCILLFTCHRTEVYFSAHDLAAAHSVLLHLLREEIPFPFEHKLYAYFGSDCFVHLAQVTSGLDSMIMGESEIQRQVKRAYEQTSLHYALPSAMHYLFQKSLHLGKHLRSHWNIPKGQATIPKMIHEIWGHICSDKQKLLFIGNSEINRKTLAYFKLQGITQITLCTRSAHSAQEMASEWHIDLKDWSELPNWGNYDVVICGTNASSFLIHPKEEGVQTRLIFDLGVPRNVDPRLSRHPRLALFNIDELGELLQKRQKTHSAEIQKSELLLQEKVHYYVTAFQEKEKSRLSFVI